MDENQALCRGLGTGDREVYPLAVERKLAPRIGDVVTAKHLDEGGLTGAIAAHESVNLTSLHIEIYIDERSGCPEGLKQSGELQDCLGHHVPFPRSCVTS